jgi:hypothetical protein
MSNAPTTATRYDLTDGMGQPGPAASFGNAIENYWPAEDATTEGLARVVAELWGDRDPAGYRWIAVDFELVDGEWVRA